MSAHETLDDFTQYSVPEALVVTFTQDGAAQDLTGYTAEAVWSSETEAASAAFACTITDAANGVVSVPWPAAAFAATGRHFLEVWVGDTTNRYGTLTYDWAVTPALTTTAPTL